MRRILLIGIAVTAALLPVPPWWVERLYSGGLYPRLQPIVTSVSSALPIALLDVGAAALLLAAIALALSSWRDRRSVPMLRRLLTAAAMTAAVLYLWFLSFWGLNYRRVPLEQKLVYEVSRITRERGREFARTAVEQVNALAGASTAVAVEEAALAQALREVAARLGGPRPPALARPKQSLVTLYFRKAAIDGMTNPFFLEVIINPDLLPSERSFTLAHEWAHLAGYADESEANFIAWLACLRASPSARYSGWLSAYQHVASALPLDDRRALAAALSPAVVADLNAQRARFRKSSPAVRTAARGAYDTYLRANRIEEGIANYDAVVRLMLGASFDERWVPRLR